MTLVFEKVLEEVYPDDTKITPVTVYVCPHRGIVPHSYEVIVMSKSWINKYFISVIDARYISRLMDKLQIGNTVINGFVTNELQYSSNHGLRNNYTGIETRLIASFEYFVRYDQDNYFRMYGFTFYRKNGNGYDRVKFLQQRREVSNTNNDDTCTIL